MQHAVLALATVALAALAWSGTGCGDSQDPTEVVYGQTTLVVITNPTINEATQTSPPQPGGLANGIRVELDDGPAGTSDGRGVVVLSPVPAGARTLSLSGMGLQGSIGEAIADKDLIETALAVGAASAESMGRVVYPFGGTVVEVTPEMTTEQVNQALTSSQTIVFFHGGTYTGDLVFSGSNATLFGEGGQGGQVTLAGSVTVDGSSNRIRGTTITGDLTVSGSDFGLSFSRVAGQTTIDASDATFLLNEFCGAVTLNGSGFTALGNQGMAPLATPDDC
jgi:hypothetical protein